MPYSTAYYLNDVTITLSAAWEIPNLFPQSEPAQISSTIFPALLFDKLHMVHFQIS